MEQAREPEGGAAERAPPPGKEAASEPPAPPSAEHDADGGSEARPVREWSDDELLRPLDAPSVLLPAQRLRIQAEASRRGITPPGAWGLLWRGVRAFLDRPGSSLVMTIVAGGVLIGWPVLVVWLLERHWPPAWLLLAAGWGAVAGAGALFPALLGLALAISRRRGPSLASLLAGLRRLPAASAGLALALTLAVPGLAAGIVPCVGSWVVLSCWSYLLLGAGAATCFAIEQGLDPLGAMEAVREAERRRGRGARVGLSLLLGGLPYGVGILAVMPLFFAMRGPGEEALVGMFALLGLLLAACLALALHATCAYYRLLEGTLVRTQRRAPPALRPEEQGLLPRSYLGAAPPGWWPWRAAALFSLALGTPFWSPVLVEILQEAMLPVALWAAVPTVHLAAVMGGFAILHVDRQRRRRVDVDAAGVLLDVGPQWPGTRVEWTRIRGYLLEEDGVRLLVEGQRLSRWLGPLVPARDRDAHELLLVLDRRRIPRL